MDKLFSTGVQHADDASSTVGAAVAPAVPHAAVDVEPAAAVPAADPANGAGQDGSLYEDNQDIVVLDADADYAELEDSLVGSLLFSDASPGPSAGTGVQAAAAGGVGGAGALGAAAVGVVGGAHADPAAIVLAGRLFLSFQAREAKFAIASTLALEKQLQLELASFAIRQNQSQAQHAALVGLLRGLAHAGLLTPAQLAAVPSMRSTLKWMDKLALLTDTPLLQSISYNIDGLRAPLMLHFNPLVASLTQMLQNPALADATFYHDPAHRTHDFDPGYPYSHPWNSDFMRTIVNHELAQCRAHPQYSALESMAKLQGRPLVILVMLLSLGHDDTALGWGRHNGSPAYVSVLNFDADVLLSQSSIFLLAMLDRGKLRASEASTGLISAVRNAHQHQLADAYYKQLNAARRGDLSVFESVAVRLDPPPPVETSPPLYVPWLAHALAPADHVGRAGDHAVIRQNLCTMCLVAPGQNAALGATFPDRSAHTAADLFDQLAGFAIRQSAGEVFSAPDAAAITSIVSQLEKLGQRSDVPPALFSLDRSAGAWQLPRGPFDVIPPDLLHTISKGLVILSGLAA